MGHGTLIYIEEFRWTGCSKHTPIHRAAQPTTAHGTGLYLCDVGT